MGKFASERNFGYGKHMAWAGKQALKDYYGGGKYGTVETHCTHWRHFCAWAYSIYDVRDAREVEQQLVEGYAMSLGEMVDEELLAVSYAQNLLSGMNVTLEALRRDRKVRIASPSEWVGQRSVVRVDVPTGFDWQTIQVLVARLQELGLLRAAVVVRLARYFGVRLREAVLADIAQWQKQARHKGAIDVRNGTKGGRGKAVERWIAVSDVGMRALEEAARVRDLLGCETNLLRPDESFDNLVNDREINLARRYLHDCGVKGYHDLRAAWACERYQQITGIPAPVFHFDGPIDLKKDRAAREILAPELGHDRIAVVAEYVGARPFSATCVKNLCDSKETCDEH